MNTFRLKIYQGSDKTSHVKWSKQDELVKWELYQHFYCDGAESIVCLNISALWQSLLCNKQTHFEQKQEGTERILCGRYFSYAKSPFYIEIDLQN